MLESIKINFYLFLNRFLSSRLFYRLLESFPGLVSWSFILIPIAFIPFYPEYVALFSFFYSIYWTYSVTKFILFAYLAHKELEKNSKIDWLERLNQDYPRIWDDYYYCAIIPYATESISIIRKTLQSILEINYPNEKKIICLSSEKAIPQGAEIAKELKREFKDKFKYFFVTEHELKPGELKGKASNQNHAARFLINELEKLGISLEKVLVTSNDADMLNHKQYIPYLLHTFLSEGEDKYKRIYQPIPTDYDGFWNARFFSRIIVTIGAQWRLSLQYRGDYRCSVYSFYSMSLKTLKDIGLWDVDNIPEDERTMFKALFTFGKDFRVVPLYITTTGRPIQGDNLMHALIEQYKQVRRWAWGVSEFAHSVSKSIKAVNISWRVKLLYIFNQIRTSTEWSLTSVIPMFGVLLTSSLNPEYNETTVSHYIANISSYLFLFSSSLVVVILFIESKILHQKPNNKLILLFHSFALFFLIPYVGFFLSAIPALESQTRLMFNKRIEYVASKKE